MNKLTISAGAVATAGALVLVGVGVTALASSTPPADVHAVGTLQLHDGTGAVRLQGSLTDPIAATAVGDANLPAGSKAVLFAYVYGDPSSAPTAVASFAPSGLWTGTQLTAAQPFSGTPAVTIDASTETLGQFVSSHTLPADGLVELRLRTVQGSALSDDYDALRVYVSGGSWSTTPASASSSAGSPSSSPTTSSTPSSTASSTASAPATSPAPTSGTAAPVSASVTERIATKVKHTAKVKITVVVSAPGVVPTGTVTVFDGSKRLASKALASGTATLKLPKLKKGKHKIRSVYAGSPAVTAASSKTIVVTSR